MCLENRIVELTAAVERLTLALAGGAPAATEAPVAPKGETKATATKPKTETKGAPAAEPEKVEEAPVEVKLDYKKDVAPLLVQVSEREDLGRDAVIKLLAKFGMKTAKDMPEDKYQPVIDEAKKLLGV